MRIQTRSMSEITMKRLTDLENDLLELTEQLDCAMLKKKKVENENAEIRADMEAYKLSISEFETTRLEALKREKKCLKKLGVLEKEKKKLQDDIAAEKQKISDLQQQLVEIEAASKEAEAKWRQAERDKEQAFAVLKEEQRLKKAIEASNKRKLEGMRLRAEIDFQRHKDDLQQLEQELSRLKASNEHPEGDVARILHAFDRLEVSSENDASSDRECLICRESDVSVVFLPCAHQVLCANCNDNYGEQGRAICPCCEVPIEQRIRVFGATS